MGFHSFTRSRDALAMAVAAMPFLAGSIALAQSYSTTPVTVFTAASIESTSVTDGLNSSSNVADLVERDSSVIAGYAKTSSFEQIYYLSPQSPFPNTPSLVSLTDSGHLQSSSTPSLIEVSPTGLLLGTQTRVDSTGSTTTQLGSDVFTSTGSGTPTIIPLPTAVLGAGTASYSYTNTQVNQTEYAMSTSADTDATFNYNTDEIGPGGIVVGSVTRYSGDANNGGPFGAAAPLGNDGFYYSGGTTTAIGLSGPNYDAVPSTNEGLTNPALTSRGCTVTGLAGTNAIGFTTRVTSTGGALGYDSWLYNPTVQTVQIGLVGGIYSATVGSSTYEESQTFRTNTLGQVAGKSYVPVQGTGSLSGTNVGWIYTPSSTPGSSSTFGTSAAGTYTQVGLTALPSATTLGYFNTTSTTFNTNLNITFLNNQGHAAGTSNRYDAAGNYEGGAAWYYDGTTNIDISPVDSIHQAVAGGAVYSSNTLTAVNNKGLVAAYATRVAGTATGSAALGQDAYVYDDNTHTEYFVDPAHESLGTGNYELSYIGSLSDSGVAVGYYNTYSGTSSTVLSSVLFDWSEATGLQPLVTYNGSAAANSMAAYVQSFEFGSNGTLYGPNTYGSAATSIVAYTVVPEPTSLGLLTAGALGLLRRRRRIA